MVSSPTWNERDPGSYRSLASAATSTSTTGCGLGWNSVNVLGEGVNLELFLGATSTGINNKLALLSSLEATAQRSLPTPARSLSQAKRTKGYKPASQPSC